MEHFLNNTDDHNSSFFQPPTQDDELEANNESNPPSHMEITSSVKAHTKPEESLVPAGRPRSKIIDEEANIKLQVLVSNFSDEQLDRYEMYRRSAFSKVASKRLMHSSTGTVPSSNVVIVMAGIAKVFVDEIAEEALEVQRQENENKTTTSSPLEPRQLREAHRRINNQPHCPQRKTWKAKKKSRF